MLDEFESSEDVIIAEIIGVEEAPVDDYDRSYKDGIKGAKMAVKKVYKGNLKVGDEVFFEQGGGSDCIWTYSKENTGGRLLIYTSPDENGLRKVVVCGRSEVASNVPDDLLYLDNLEKLKGKTRFSGSVKYSFFGGYPEGQKLEGKKIKIRGKNGNYEAITDKNGIYEIYDLPAGEYSIEPEIPKGWKIDPNWLRYSPSFQYENMAEAEKNQFTVKLEDKRHISLDFYYEINNGITGKLIDPNGNPMKDVCVYAVAAEATDFGRSPYDCTDKNGVYSIAHLLEKNYVLTIQGDRKAGSKESSKTLFYPGVIKRAQAKVITMKAGAKITMPVFRVPKLPSSVLPEIVKTVSLTGKLIYSDGIGVEQSQKIFFLTSGQSIANVSENFIESNRGGAFSIRTLRGKSFIIQARMLVTGKDLEDCPKIRKSSVKESPWGAFYLTTAPVRIRAGQDISKIRLIFPFPKCKEL